ncbi:MAG: hypothetical protein KDB69_03150, partial [Acidimicrobiia bacterium]|nr:hypothetical protein [Acidimicrobiia bacterium]
AGLGGLEPSDEDDLTGDLIAAVIGGASADPPGARHLIASCPRADQLRALAWAGPRDVDMCCDVDRFGFALEALEDERGLVRLVRRRPAASGILDRW